MTKLRSRPFCTLLCELLLEIHGNPLPLAPWHYMVKHIDPIILCTKNIPEELQFAIDKVMTRLRTIIVHLVLSHLMILSHAAC